MDFRKWLYNNASSILTGIGGIGIITTVALSVKATPGAFIKLEAAKAMKRRASEDERKPVSLTPLEAVKMCWKDYIPAAAVGTGSLCCIIGANVLSRKQQASLASAYTALAGTFSAYRDKVKLLCGEETDRAITKAVEQEAEDKEDDRPPWDEGQTFYLECCGKPEFFEKTMEEVLLAEYHINRNFVLRGYVTVNEFLGFLNLAPVEGGDESGWDEYIGETIDGYHWIDFNHRHFVTDDGLSVCAIDMPFPERCLNYDDDTEENVQTCGVD